MRSSIPDGSYELKIGESFTGSAGNFSQNEFNTLKFDFKPASISSGSEAYMAMSSSDNDVKVIVPGEGDKSAMFRGAKKTIKDKECLLVFDHETKELRLEKISANINVKKTRDGELDNKVKEEIDRMRRMKMPPPPTPVKEPKKERSFSMSSNSHDEDEHGENMEVDEDASALELMIGALKPNEEVDQKSPQKSPPKQPLPAKKMPSPTKTHKGAQQKSILHEDLQLSESSEGED